MFSLFTRKVKVDVGNQYSTVKQRCVQVARVNVEFCNYVNSIKFVCKYIDKSLDTVTYTHIYRMAVSS